MSLRVILLLVLIPAALAVAVLLAGRLLPQKARSVASALAVGLGFVGGAFVVTSPAWSPSSAEGWLLHLALAAAFCASAAAAWLPRAAEVTLWAALGTAASFLLLEARIEHAWTAPQAAIAVGGLGLALPLTVSALSGIMPAGQVRVRLTGLAAAAAVSAVLAVFAETVKVGLLLGGLAAAAGAAEAISWVWPRVVASRAAAAVVATVLWGAWIVIWAYAGLGAVPFALALAAGPAAWLAYRLVPAGRQTLRRPAAWTILLVVIGAAAGLEARDYLAPPAEEEGSSYDYGYGYE